jgi:phosphoribosylamine--glycine ligase
VAPGNVLIADEHPVRAVVPTDAAAVVELARAESADLVVIGPEAPLATGVSDALVAAGIAVFGPGAEAARIEASKAWCREIAWAAGVPMAEGRAFESSAAAVAFARSLGGHVVVKADGLAGGKGVTVCARADEAEAAIHDALERGIFGAAGRRVIVEERLEGPEASVIALTDGRALLALPAARDHKRLGEGNSGPNTGGMGAFSPSPDVPDEDVTRFADAFHRPVLRELERRGTPFRGALYAGLILTADGARLLEFNARFGDPETQVLMPRLAAPLGALLLAAATGRLDETMSELRLDPVACTRPLAAAALVVAAAGYPGAARKGDAIEGIDVARSTGAHVFGAGVHRDGTGTLVTAGGRVLTVVATGADVAAAADAAHAAADLVRFAGAQQRRDIGRAAVAAGRSA